MVHLSTTGTFDKPGPQFSHDNYSTAYFDYIVELDEYQTKDKRRWASLQRKITDFCLLVCYHVLPLSHANRSLSDFVEEERSVKKGVNVGMVESDEEICPPRPPPVPIPEEPGRAGPSWEEKGKGKEQQAVRTTTSNPSVEAARERLRQRRDTQPAGQSG